MKGLKKLNLIGNLTKWIIIKLCDRWIWKRNSWKSTGKL